MHDGLLMQGLLPLVNVLIMLSVGLALRVGDFRSVGWRAWSIGLVAHYLYLPVLGFALVAAWRAQPAIALGFMLICACPSASVSNLISHFAGGNVALAVLLTASSALITLLSVPLLTDLAAQWLGGQAMGLRLPWLATITRLLLLVILPIAAGMLLRHFAPVRAQSVQPALASAGALGLALVVIAYVLRQPAAFAQAVVQLGGACLALALAALVGGWWLARLGGLAQRDAITLALETGVINCMLALLIASQLMQAPAAMAPAVVYGVLVLLLAPCWGLLLRRRRRPCSMPAELDA